MLRIAVDLLAALGGASLGLVLIFGLMFVVSGLPRKTRTSHVYPGPGFSIPVPPVLAAPISAARRSRPISLWEFPAADQAVLREVGARVYPEVMDDGA